MLENFLVQIFSRRRKSPSTGWLYRVSSLESKGREWPVFLVEISIFTNTAKEKMSLNLFSGKGGQTFPKSIISTLFCLEVCSEKLLTKLKSFVHFLGSFMYTWQATFVYGRSFHRKCWGFCHPQKCYGCF